VAELSPAAQAVLHSFWDAPVSPARNCQIAAALRAAAEELYDSPSVDYLWAIADELDNTNNTREGD
jgi:hypothetical protein